MDLDNYRPVSVLPILGRLLEKLVGRQLQDYCTLNSIIPIQQFGFRSHSSCELALLAAQDKWLDEVSRGSFVGALLIDLTKAFDSIEHQQLIDELNVIGCDDKALQWFTNFLTNRSQRVKVGNSVSEWKPVSKGVPQGSSLSPLLFNILVRHLPARSGSHCLQFADDLTNSVAEKTPDLLRSKLELVYNNVKRFCQSINLDINLKKTQLIVFKSSTRQLPKDFEVVLDGIYIKPVVEVKLLGVHFDQHLTMSKHIDATVSKCHGLLGVLRRASKTLPRDLLKLAYSSLIRSQLEYCSAVFAMSAPSRLSKLDVIQKIASRIITSSEPQAHSAPLLELLGLESLHQRRVKHISSIVTNILIGKSHPFFTDYFTDRDPSLLVPKTSSRTAAKRFSAFGINTYDEYHKSRNLQSLLMGRPPRLTSLTQSALTNTNYVSFQVIPVQSIVISDITSSQLEALVEDALEDYGEEKDTINTNQQQHIQVCSGKS